MSKAKKVSYVAHSINLMRGSCRSRLQQVPGIEIRRLHSLRATRYGTASAQCSFSRTYDRGNMWVQKVLWLLGKESEILVEIDIPHTPLFRPIAVICDDGA